MFSGRGLEGGSVSIGPRQEIVDFAIGMAVDDFSDDVGEIGEGLDVVELARLDQRGDNGPMLAAAVGAREECVLAIQRDGANAALDNIGIDFDAAVVDEAGETFPTRERIADRLGEFCLLADQCELFAQPWLKNVEDRLALLLADSAPLLG